MFKYLLNREDTLSFVKQLFNNKVYYEKKNSNKEDIIGTFYDALFKYSVIVNDDEYFEDYLVNLKLLFNKIDNLDEITPGINKLLSKIILNKLNTEDKDLFIDYVYDKYIDNGYFIHAYSGVYYDDIDMEGFNIDEYYNLYDRFIKVQSILTKYGCYVIDKDFSDKTIYFTDSMKLAYYYSNRSPYYFYNLICGEEFIKNKDSYSSRNYKECLANVKKVCFRYSLSTEDEKFVIDTFNQEWKLLNNDSNVSSFMLVERNALKHDKFDLEEFKEKYRSEDYDVILDRLIDNNYSNLKCRENIKREDINFIYIDNNYEYEKKKEKEVIDEFDFVNSYGKVSLLLLLGSIFITLGVIITLIFVV